MSELAFCAGLLLVAHAVAPILRSQKRRWIGPCATLSIVAMASGLLLCWVPIIGDPLTVIAGVMTEPKAVEASWWS